MGNRAVDIVTVELVQACLGAVVGRELGSEDESRRYAVKSKAGGSRKPEPVGGKLCESDDVEDELENDCPYIGLTGEVTHALLGEPFSTSDCRQACEQ